MYAVIFRAQVRELDAGYTATAERMRELALSEYGCLEFVSASEGGQEIAISYWPSLEAIQNWRQNAEHRVAQASGRERWYSRYQVEVVEVLRAYAREADI